ncbi:MAG: ChaN family lipoprotein [Cyanobacteria bacterium J06635_11]
MTFRFRLRGYGPLLLGAVLMATPIACSAGEVSELAASEEPATAINAAVPAALSTIEAAEFQTLVAADVVYLGERHDSEVDHAAQLTIIEGLYAADPDMAIALEMFQRPFQPALDAYLAGDITEAELIKQSEYESRWGYDWELYAPIIRFAKENQIPLIALNTPTEITRQVAGQGLESLSGDALTYIPPVADIDTTDEAYREAISGVFNAHGGAGHSLDFENFFAAQVLWDETMAERIVQQLEADPERQVVVLAGEGHIAYDYGIPNRVERRLPEVAQASVRLIESAQEAQPGFADFAWVTP